SALVIREALGQPDGIAATLRRLGRAESRRGEGGRALGHLVAARALLRDAGLESRLARIEVELAEVRWRRSEPDHARRHLGAASDLSGRALARHALLSALVAPRDQVLALARKAVAACERDRWRSGQLLAGALAAFVEQDVARLGAALADLERVGHAEFARLSRQWNEALEGAEETEEIDLGPR
ncbi:MAG: hypothetical protein FJ090_21430, partial [Deltaproteobacteria bacterium]|nr:hypothetical protein [Deltaproteobacteria bacterium]